MRSSDILWSSPRFVSISILAPLLSDVPSVATMATMTAEARKANEPVLLELPREAGLPVLTQMHQFNEKVVALYRNQSRRLDQMHETIADERIYLSMSVEEIATKLGLRRSGPTPSSFSPETIFALRRALLLHPYAFKPDLYDPRVSQNFEIRPRSYLIRLERAEQMIREHRKACMDAKSAGAAALEAKRSLTSAPVEEFLIKSRRLITESRSGRRRIRSALGPSLENPVAPSNVSPSVRRTQSIQERLSERFSQDDQDIIFALKAWCSYREVQRHSSMFPLGSWILRAVGMYEEDLTFDPDLGVLFLQEIGVHPPWLDTIFLDRTFKLLTSSTSSSSNGMPVEETPSLSDSMEDMRRDWGSMPVYCIDAASALEIDDGISIEPTSDPSRNWIHVHVADPCAFISPDHPIAKKAKESGSTIYLPGQAFPMLPSSIVQEQLSLAPGRPSITFSGLIDSDGSISDVKITPGVVQNVIFITPTKVREIIGAERSPGGTWIVGSRTKRSTLQNRSCVAEIPAQQRNDLVALQTVADSLHQRRLQMGQLHTNMNTRPDVFVSFNSPTPLIAPETTEMARFFDGDPSIQLKYPSPDTSQPELDIVAPFMILASQIATKWCFDRNVPIPYRGSVPRAAEPINHGEFFRHYILPTRKRLGYDPPELAQKYINLAGRSKYSLEPLPLVTLGLNMYTRCTSPLRRFADMVVHWQIQAALRHEMLTGESLIRCKTEEHHFLPFSSSDLNNLLPLLTKNEREIRRLQSRSLKSWSAQLIARSFYFHETVTPLPPTLSMVLLLGFDLKSSTIRGWVKELGVMASMQSVLEDQEKLCNMKKGEVWKVALERVETVKGNVIVRPLERLKKSVTEEEGIDWPQ